MSDQKYVMVPVELLKDWYERINTIAAETAFNVADEMEASLAAAPQAPAAPAVQGEPLRHPATPSFFEHPTFDESADMDPCMLRGRHD